MENLSNKTVVVVFLAISFAFLGGVYFFLNRDQDDYFYSSGKNQTKNSGQKSLLSSDFKPFSSEEEFRSYLEEGRNIMGRSYFGGGQGVGTEAFDRMVSPEMSMGGDFVNKTVGSSASSPSAVPERFSTTNTQVLSIDEPDIVKTDGKNIYYAESKYVDYRYEMDDFDEDEEVAGEKWGCADCVPPRPERKRGIVNIIRALPLADAKKIGEIEKEGEIFLEGNVLVVLADYKKKIYGFDISNPEKPVKSWSLDLGSDQTLVGSRMIDGKVFLVTRSFISGDTPCPVKPLIQDGIPIQISCFEIYHPETPMPVDATYSFVSLNAKNGEVMKKNSLVGSISNAVLYMSKEHMYLTYQEPVDQLGILSGFVEENKDLLPENVVSGIKKLSKYDLSNSTKLEELNYLMGKHVRSLKKDDLLKLQNEMNNRLAEYAKKGGRENETTGIVKIKTQDLSIEASGSVPGHPLNQFSLDEHQGNLRIAITFMPLSSFPGGFWNRSNSNQASDVYVLDENLKSVGSVKDLGKGERIYSVRFLGDKGYVVTFKQVDPFFVLDFSDPQNPELKGELKIPGFSSYLHPLSKDQILGIGQEDGKVKLTVFEVSDPKNPSELSTYHLDDNWTEVENNHHAFLLDEKHGVFFLPGSKGGYVFEYAGGLKLKKAISDFGVKRAVYINDFLYVIGGDTIRVINEKTWSDEKEIEL